MKTPNRVEVQSQRAERPIEGMAGRLRYPPGTQPHRVDLNVSMNIKTSSVINLTRLHQ